MGRRHRATLTPKETCRFTATWCPGRSTVDAMPIHRRAREVRAGELRTLKARIRQAAKARKVALPDPDEFVELMDRVRKKRER